MTAPKVPHAALIADLRGLADLLKGLGNRATLRRAADTLAAVTAERDQARQMLADAPHEEYCESKGWALGNGQWGINPEACDCWKVGL